MTSTQPASAIFTHTLVVLEEGAEAFLVDAFRSDTVEGQSFASGVVELILRQGAKLRYVQVQDWGRDVWSFMTERATSRSDATLNSLHVTLGSKFSKNSIGSHLRGENSLAEMLGIFFADGDQFFDHHTWQLHESPYATSDLEFKGALKDQARSVYSGLIKVSEGAQKTDAYQQNRNLVLSRDGARRLDPEPGDRRQRCALHPRRHHLAGRTRAPLLPPGSRYPPHRSAEADRRRLLPPGDRPYSGRGDPGLPGRCDRPQGGHLGVSEVEFGVGSVSDS